MRTSVDISEFLVRGQSELAPFLSGVSQFVAHLGTPGGLPRSDLRAKPPEQYIRNMMAVGVLTHLMRESFMATSRRIIVLPECLKNENEETCCKADTGNGQVCTQCNSDCLVFATVEKFAVGDVTIILEPDDHDRFFANARRRFGTVGVVGVACALTLLSGFHSTLKYKLPTQGVFLNYAACEHHWAEPGRNTYFDFRRMGRVMGIDVPQVPPAPAHGDTYALAKGNSADDFYDIIDNLAAKFESEYLPYLRAEFPGDDIYDLCLKISDLIVPDLITRDQS